MTYYTALGVGLAILLAFAKLVYDWSAILLTPRRPLQPWERMDVRG